MRKALQDKVVLVTGVSRGVGIGAGIARRLADDGARLVIQSWPPHDAEQPWGDDPGFPEALRGELRDRGVAVQHQKMDLADRKAPEELIAAAVAEYGRLDAVVANHARSSGQDLEHLTAEEIDLSYAVNVRATLLLVKEFAARFEDDTSGGRVVLFTSGQYHGAMPSELPYIASKAALHELTASLAVHLMPRGITVNCIDPGPNDTGYADPHTLAEVAASMPGGRWGAPSDAAKLVAWLLSDDAEWVTGQTIASDGGWSSR